MQRNITSKTSTSTTHASRRPPSFKNGDEKEALHRIPGTIDGTSPKNTPTTIGVGSNSNNDMMNMNGSSSSPPPIQHQNRSSSGGSLYYNNENDDESRGIIFSDNKSHGDENPTWYYDDEINRLRQDIQFWNKFLTIGNTSVLLFSVLVLVLYFTTDMFPKEQQQHHNWNVTEIFTTVSNRCLNETIMEKNDIGTFMECATFCSDVKPCCDGDQNSNYDTMKNVTTILQSTEPFEMKESSICQKTNGESDDFPNNNNNNNNNHINHFSKQQCHETCTPIINTTYMTYFTTYMQRICNVETIEKSKKAYKLCEEKCVHFDCCFSIDESQNCLGDAGYMCGSFFDACVHVKENAAMFGYGVGPQLIEPSD